MRIAVLALLLLAGVAAAAAGNTGGGENNGGAGATPATSGTVIYQSTDANGNTVFSDQPPRDRPSKTIQLGPTNAVPMATPAPSKPKGGKVGFPGYSSLAINSPSDGATIRNPDKPIVVHATATPPLQPGDTLKLRDNGSELSGMSLDNPNRGTHILQAEVVGKDGEVLIQSPSVTIYVHRTSVSQQSGNHSGSSSGVASFGSAASTGSAASAGGASSPGSGASTGSAASLGQAASPSMSPPPK